MGGKEELALLLDLAKHVELGKELETSINYSTFGYVTARNLYGTVKMKVLE